MKKGRHRRFEEARALKRDEDLDIEDLFDSLNDENPSPGTYKPEHDAWSDLADDANPDEDEKSAETG